MLIVIKKAVSIIYYFSWLKYLWHMTNRILSSVLKHIFYSNYYIYWFWITGYKRVSIAKTAVINNALLNVNSWKIYIKDYVFFWHNVCILTGTHDYNMCNEKRLSFPIKGHDITIQKWVWLWSNVTVLWPCIIGEYSVVAAGAVVTKDIPAYTLWGGVPAKLIKEIPRDM